MNEGKINKILSKYSIIQNKYKQSIVPGNRTKIYFIKKYSKYYNSKYVRLVSR